MKRYTVGIDLGTSNTVVAYVEAGVRGHPRRSTIEQLVRPGEVAARAAAAVAALSRGARRTRRRRLCNCPGQHRPRRNAQPVVIGRLARTLGAQVPGRLVASAKSWLSHAVGRSRRADSALGRAGDDVAKISPVAASASYLAHVRAAWNQRFPDAPLETQDVVLTVPASFDEGARALTLEAARMAGLPALRLLEEPQAAFYDWLFHHRETLDDELRATPPRPDLRRRRRHDRPHARSRWRCRTASRSRRASASATT